MLKTILLTASLAASAAYIGYNADTIGPKIVTEVSAEINAAVGYFTYDAKAEYYACMKTAELRDDDTADAFLARVKTCTTHLNRWVARDGRRAVAEHIYTQGMIDINRTLREALPGLAVNAD
jgi:hypothetical protein